MNRNRGQSSNKKPPQMSISIERLHLDKDNPRLPEETQGKNQSALLKVLNRDFNLTELADSFAKNGYFNEEPLVAIPKKLPEPLAKNAPRLTDQQYSKFIGLIHDEATQFTVVEGNRRLATCKLLLDVPLRKELGIRHWPQLSDMIRNDLEKLPAIVYQVRKEVVPYLGVRHIVGIQKWDSYAKARYIARLVEQGRPISEVEELVGDKKGSARKIYICYKLVQQLEEDLDFNTKPAKNNFSFLMLAIGHRPVKEFIGLPTRLVEVDSSSPVPEARLLNLRNLASWVFGDGKNLAVIKESRDITNFLTHVLSSPEAVEHLEATRRLEDAYELTDGEEKMLIRKLRQANSRLETALGIVHRHRTDDVRYEIKKCVDTLQRLNDTIQEKE